ncbi:MAG: N-6 DNA methylase [Candidatus Accumulibacter propinquus]
MVMLQGCANPDLLAGIFGDSPWTNRERLPDETLKNLIEHFSTQILSVTNVPEDELGNAYEFLIKKFADDSGHTAAELYTNRTVVHLMTQLLAPRRPANRSTTPPAAPAACSFRHWSKCSAAAANTARSSSTGRSAISSLPASPG